MNRGYLSKEERAGRLMSGGKIESLATPFRTPIGVAFGLTIVPKANYDELTKVITVPEAAGLVVDCTYYDDAAPGPHPFFFNYPNEALLYEVSAGAIDLDVYDVYWSSLVAANPV